MASTFCVFLFYCTTLLLLFSIVAAATTDEAEADRVRNLPGQPPVKFRHYAGYVKLSPHSHRAFFYWFFEAEQAPSQKPLLLWLNGGPGCSSVAYGAAQELGPFLVQNKGNLKLNKFSWNKVANVLFLESPVGVGFSYTNNSQDLSELGDGVTAIDNYAFLLQWFKRFPSFKSSDFYIAGESYAGHYVPQLAELIYDGNKDNKKGSYINLKGFMIGNAVINDVSDTKGLVEYAWSHAIVSNEVYDGIVKECDFNADNQTRVCVSHIRELLGAYSQIDIYSIYSPVCLSFFNTNSSFASSISVSSKLLVAPRLLTSHELWHKLPSGYDPCTEDYVSTYFNRKDVQEALHANITNLSYPYSPCSSVIEKWNDSATTVLPIINKLLRGGLRIWIFSGDTDGRVPVTSTRYSIEKMGLKTEAKWRAWFDDHQVGGWTQVYEGGLSFVTVRGAGHQVPAYAPRRSLSLVSHFLSNQSLPSTRF